MTNFMLILEKWKWKQEKRNVEYLYLSTLHNLSLQTWQKILYILYSSVIFLPAPESSPVWPGCVITLATSCLRSSFVFWYACARVCRGQRKPWTSLLPGDPTPCVCISVAHMRVCVCVLMNIDFGSRMRPPHSLWPVFASHNKYRITLPRACCSTKGSISAAPPGLL